jgi:ion channel
VELALGLMLARFARAARRAWDEPEFRALAAGVLSLIATGTVVYTLGEGWSVAQGLYFAVMTLTTSDTGGLHLTGDVLRLFTVLYSLLGIALLLRAIWLLGRGYLQARDDLPRPHNPLHGKRSSVAE